MALGDKILEFMLDDSSPTFNKRYTHEELSLNCKICKEDILPMLRHLANIGYITTSNKKGWVSNHIEDKEISLSSKGIQYLEEKTPRKIKTWSPIIISLGALVIAIIALLKP